MSSATDSVIWRSLLFVPSNNERFIDKAHTRGADGIILDLEGKITIGEGDVKLRNTIDKILAAGHRRILLNMARVSYMDSSGIGELLDGLRAVNEQDGWLKLLNISTKIKDLLQITQLLSVFEYFDSEEKALQSFH